MIFSLFLYFPKPYDIKSFLVVGGSSILGTLGSYAITEAVVYGKAGPSQALCEIQASFMLLLEVLIVGKVPNALQVLGFGFGIFAVLIIS